MTDTSDDTSRPDALRFRDDPGARRSTWIAGLILVAVVAWMGSGLVLPGNDPDPVVARADAPAPTAVAVRPSVADDVTLTFRAEGQAQPDRDTALLAEASGDVAEVLVDKGRDVERDQVIARLSTTRLEADLRRAEGEAERAQREFDNASQLLDRGVATVDRVTDARTALTAAEAQVAAAREALDAARITAPFAGRVETLSLDAGEFVQAGTQVGRIVDNSPLTVAIQVPQQALQRIESGQPAAVSFITGETAEGEVAFVGTAAASETRTFLVEIEVPNRDGAIRAGISAEVTIPTGRARAHFISPSIVSLGPEGRIGVKAVEDGRVAFYPVEVVRAEIEGIFVTGLPDAVDLITVGQGFVRDGEAVTPQPETDLAEPAEVVE
ncbi:efflux RND transporter periplasmic adaptor subunit [Jannaschia sp. LMIT008]|uniref:efflux RND transporter periplasmic adaptor subunit n=1 Tax=Jannaschia maritima TaxID=3032585 RepID=UPI002810A74E|nr:efflux RND transporter periplasmic adaptor subunit [Jannaschia sp. LMIT008]